MKKLLIPFLIILLIIYGCNQKIIPGKSRGLSQGLTKIPMGVGTTLKVGFETINSNYDKLNDTTDISWVIDTLRYLENNGVSSVSANRLDTLTGVPTDGTNIYINYLDKKLHWIAGGYDHWNDKAYIDSIAISSGTPSTLNNGLIAHWNLDQNSTTQTDDVGSNNLTVTGATYYSTDAKIGHAVDFTGTTNYLLKSSGSLTLGTDAVTISAWFKLDNMPATGFTSIIELTDQTDATIVANIRLYSGGQIECNVKNTAHANFSAYTNNGVVTTGVYYNVVFINYGNGQNPKVFINDTDATAGYDTFSGALNTGCNYILVGNYYGLDAAIDGRIYDPLIYNRALTSGEITELYDKGLLAKTKPWE